MARHKTTQTALRTEPIAARFKQLDHCGRAIACAISWGRYEPIASDRGRARRGPAWAEAIAAVPEASRLMRPFPVQIVFAPPNEHHDRAAALEPFTCSGR
jgi:hypothetical protein